MISQLLELLNKIASAIIEHLPDILKSRRRKKLDKMKSDISGEIDKAREESLSGDVKSVNDKTLKYMKEKNL